MNVPRVSFVQTNASVLLDLTRGLAALLVVIGHARNFLFIDYKQLPEHHLWTSFFYLLTKAGHQGVIIFFVLSGYLISGSIFRAIDRNSWNWPLYLTHRIVRLWVVLIPGLLLCALLDRYALSHQLAPSIYLQSAAHHMGTNVAANSTPVIFLQNLFFVQVILGPTFGSDTALWSLAYEFWYYMLFPLALFTVAPSSRLSHRLMLALVLACVGWFAHVVPGLFPVWLAGTLLAIVPIPKLRPIIRLLATIVFLVIFFFSAGSASRFPEAAGDYFLTTATFFFLWILLSAANSAPASVFVRGSRGLARFSYTLYVVHTPFLLLLTALVVGETRWTPTLITLLEAGSIVAVTLLYAYGIANLTEFHTDAVRRWIEKRLEISSGAEP